MSAHGDLVGVELGPTSWLEVTQERIDAFAAATDDPQWIHTDPKRAAAGPFGTTVAHGYLTLSLCVPMLYEVLPSAGAMVVNYGVNRVRFPAPVPSGARIRGRFRVVSVEEERRRAGDHRGDRRMRGVREARLRGRARGSRGVLTTPDALGHVCYPGAPVGRGRTRSVRIAVTLAFVTALAGVVAATAAALAFDDATPCPVTIDNGQGLFVCPGGTVGTSYSVQLIARGGCEPSFSFSVVNGAMPAGLSMSSNGLISGTPTQAGRRGSGSASTTSGRRGRTRWCTSRRTPSASSRST